MKKNLFAFVIDRSGSMNSYINEALKAFNENLQSVREGQNTFADQTSLAAVVAFSHTVEILRPLTPIDVLRPIDSYEYRAGGNTALFDAVSVAKEHLENHYLAKDPETSFVVVVITDGEENASRFYSAGRFTKDMKKLEKEDDRWTFAFMLPRGLKRQFVNNFEIPEGNCSEWETTAKGMERAAQTVNTSVTAYYGTRASGQRKSTTFFAHISDLDKDVLSNMIDVTNSVKVMHPVADEHGMQIRDFASSRGLSYTPGMLYYMLLKSEKVQPQKNLIIRDTVNNKFYSGPAARKAIGLPLTGEHRLRPGNQGKYEVYVESTSYNRKVVRGMKMIQKF